MVETISSGRDTGGLASVGRHDGRNDAHALWWQRGGSRTETETAVAPYKLQSPSPIEDPFARAAVGLAAGDAVTLLLHFSPRQDVVVVHVQPVERGCGAGPLAQLDATVAVHVHAVEALHA